MKKWNELCRLVGVEPIIGYLISTCFDISDNHWTDPVEDWVEQNKYRNHIKDVVQANPVRIKIIGIDYPQPTADKVFALEELVLSNFDDFALERDGSDGKIEYRYQTIYWKISKTDREIFEPVYSGWYSTRTEALASLMIELIKAGVVDKEAVNEIIEGGD